MSGKEEDRNGRGHVVRELGGRLVAPEAQEGRLFTPLAWTKTFAMLAAAIFALTLAPALAVTLLRRESCAGRPRAYAVPDRRCHAAPRVGTSPCDRAVSRQRGR